MRQTLKWKLCSSRLTCLILNPTLSSLPSLIQRESLASLIWLEFCWSPLLMPQPPPLEFVASAMQMTLIDDDGMSASVSRTFLIHGAVNIDLLEQVVVIFIIVLIGRQSLLWPTTTCCSGRRFADTWYQPTQTIATPPTNTSSSAPFALRFSTPLISGFVVVVCVAAMTTRTCRAAQRKRLTHLSRPSKLHRMFFPFSLCR